MPGVSNTGPNKTFLIVSPVYVPDLASVGQHIADAAAEMARRGYRVAVYASARGHDDPSKVYPWRADACRQAPLGSARQIQLHGAVHPM